MLIFQLRLCESLAAIEHIRGLSLGNILKTLTAPGPTPVRSMEQIMHLAALAYAENFHQLIEYIEGMNQGKRYGFAAMITREMVQRACDAAMARISDRPTGP
jgi:hypothetical protein